MTRGKGESGKDKNQRDILLKDTNDFFYLLADMVGGTILFTYMDSSQQD